MSTLRYKTLLSYLPGMASVVNTFESPQVQNAVYEKLMEALEGKLQAEGIGSPTGSLSLRDLKRFTPAAGAVAAGGEIAHELIEGDSIHADSGRGSIAPSTVF